MKNLKNIVTSIAFTLVMLIGFGVNAQKNNKPTFETSVVIIENGTDYLNSKPSDKLAFKLRLKSFDSSFKLSPVYKLDGVEYSDNGLFNDKVAGDGIYTSVQKLEYSTKKNLYDGITVNKSDKFEHSDELNSFLLSSYASKGKPKLVVKLSCKVRLVDCPNTSWYNTSWFGEPCVEFYNCEASVEIEISA